jgi:hypothetical protein
MLWGKTTATVIPGAITYNRKLFVRYIALLFEQLYLPFLLLNLLLHELRSATQYLPSRSSIRTKGLSSLQVGTFHFAIYKPVPAPLLLLISYLELLFRGTGQASPAIQLVSPRNRRMFFPLKLNVRLVKVMTLGYICPLWPELAQPLTQNFILFLFVIQRQQWFCGNPPHVQFFCLFTGLQVSQKELTTNILARQQHKKGTFHHSTAYHSNLQ